MPIISVVIPCYNSHQYLDEAIQSVRNQTIKDHEIIVINDGSTSEETKEFLNNLPTDIIVLHKNNGGPASARNVGIRHSKAEIIITLDSDDKFGNTFFAESIAILLKEKNVGVVSSYVQEIGNSSKIWRTTASDDFSFLLDNRIVACCAFRKQCWEEINGYDESMHLGLEDWDFWIRVTQRSWKVYIIQKPLFYYRKKNSSLMVDKTRPNMSVIMNYMMQKHQNWFLANLKKGIVEKRLLNKNNLSLRRTFGLFIDKFKGNF